MYCIVHIPSSDARKSFVGITSCRCLWVFVDDAVAHAVVQMMVGGDEVDGCLFNLWPRRHPACGLSRACMHGSCV